MNILIHFLELFFPRLCVCCENRLIQSETHICMDCLLKLPKTNQLTGKSNKLEDFFAGRFPFTRIASFAYFVKGGSIQKIIHEIKYRNNPDLAVYTGKLCGEDMRNNQAFEDIDFLVPVPLHTNRLKKRGYNQSLLVSQGISEIINKPINDGNLIRKIDNPSQTKNSRLERWKNSEGIFDIVDKTTFENKHILLIDDVVTTGSTIEVCAKLILSCSGSRVSIYTIGSAV